MLPIIGLIIGIIFIFGLGRVLGLSLKIIFNLIVNAIAGVITLYVFNFIGKYFGLVLEVNLLNSIIVGILGLPGVALMLIVQYLL
ncbi:MAG: pro-sigmaK processing inhibitor BofA [Tissierellia bacterium]|nr:pro-sigmaK processing inhibitor BofA [Tissierellia bacterium]